MNNDLGSSGSFCSIGRMLMRCRCGGCLLLSSIPRKVSMVSQPRERYVPEFPGYCTTLFDSIHLQNLVSIYKHCLRLAGLVRIDKGSRPTELTGNGIPARYVIRTAISAWATSFLSTWSRCQSAEKSSCPRATLPMGTVFGRGTPAPHAMSGVRVLSGCPSPWLSQSLCHGRK